MDKQATEIAIIQVQLDSQAKELENAYIVLSDQQAQLQQAQTDLADREAKLIILQTDLKNKEMALQAANEVLENQQAAMAAQAEQIDALIGIRPRIITALSSALSSANLSATVDHSTGDIVLDSSVLFDTGKSEIRAEGKALLDRFVPVYLNVLLRDEYSAYLGEIIIEGYTDSTGDYYNNLKLSQERALSVATYILKMPGLTTRQRDLLKSGLLTITGRGATGLIYDQYGNEDKEASRRVEFHFSLKDSEMIDQMNRLLQQTEGD
jgi:chemotaxis protein MotB